MGRSIADTRSLAPVPRLTGPEIDAFLGEPNHLVRIGTTGLDSVPLVVPTWFIHHEGAVVVTPRATSGFFANLRADPRTCFTIDEEQPPYRKVVVQGTVRVLREPGDDDGWRDLYRAICVRYLPEASADAYLAGTISIRRALIALPLDGSAVTTWRMPAEGEDPRAIWARRYWESS
jgi:nitroimidazol reductase NimA-like FMN-containing flavoprotein (pyridoxamine 5'-phosphate oxidase superfamily)